MWWEGPGWHMFGGWWFMPLFGIVFMIIFLYILSRIFGSGERFCGKHDQHRLQGSIDELKREIQELRAEVNFLKNKDGKENMA